MRFMATRLFQLRSRPSIRAAIVGVVLKGQDVEIREVVDSSWVAVTVHTKGFAPKNGFARVDWLAPAKTDASIDVARFTEACFEAANRYAVDPDYLLAVAQLETGVRNIPASGSPAFGPFQILPDTWSAYVAKGDLGYSPLDRFDPYHQPVVAAMIAAEAAAEFGPALPLDRPPVRSALYAAHLFGVDAARLILDGDPSEPIDTALTKTHRRRAADHLLAANRSLLMEAGQPRPVRMVLDEIGRKLESAMAARQESETIEVRASGLALSELASQRTAATAEVATLKDQTLEKSPDGVPADLVEVSAFAPAAAPADEDVLVQVYLHRLDQDALAEQLS